MSRPSAAAAAKRRRKRKKASCRTLKKRARRLESRKARRKALRKLPKRCRRPRGAGRQPLPQVPQGTQPSATQVAPPAAGTPDSVPAPPPPPSRLKTIDSPIAVYQGAFGVRQAERLLWRAGFGPRPGQAAEVAAMDLEAAVLMLTRPSGSAPMDGPEPTVNGHPLDPYGTWAHDHLWWLDRMVRSRHQLVERLALVFHDWFATSNDAVGQRQLMIAQSNLFRAHGLGNFSTLVREITTDPAMLIFLSGLENRKNAINENYARELMELFTLGADRGAYTEDDVRELARALSGWRADWVSGQGFVNFRWDELNRWDPTYKTVFGQTGRFTWEDACRLVIDHPMHASFFVRKLWSYFIPTEPSDAVVEALATRYVASGHEIRPIVEAILCAPELYEGPRMVKPPVVFAAGLMRARNRGITAVNWEWGCAGAGQKLFYPPDVSGWDDARWLDTNTMRARWELVNHSLYGETITSATWSSYPAETPEEALAGARAFWNDPDLSTETVTALAGWTQNAIGIGAGASMHAQRQNALRMLLAMSPDHHTS